MVQQLLKNCFDEKEPNNGVKPDEEVAYGTALQGTILTREAFEKIIGERSLTKDCRMLRKFDLTRIPSAPSKKELLKFDDKDTIKNVVKDALHFLDENENEDGKKESYQRKLKEVEDVCHPIIFAIFVRKQEEPTSD
ncbi:hypothetical protein FH972_012139 [Carpinus fangiana]|uniref:Uncharacterized protein n=1 Tax=Carpinus fangiana TaxID=176857 RepID=A0A5N6R5U2_9ROSI|nr:hypothetical protein FH972_012139 [Carpinus fangiana]